MSKDSQYVWSSYVSEISYLSVFCILWKNPFPTSERGLEDVKNREHVKKNQMGCQKMFFLTSMRRHKKILTICLLSCFVLLCLWLTSWRMWHIVKLFGAMTDLSPLIKFVNVQLYQLTEETHVAWQQTVSF